MTGVANAYPHTVTVWQRPGAPSPTWYWHCGCGHAETGYTDESLCRVEGLAHQSEHTRLARLARMPRALVLDMNGLIDGRRPRFNQQHAARFILSVVEGNVIVAKATRDLAEDIEPGDTWRMS